jgi:hypothetical protein
MNGMGIEIELTALLVLQLVGTEVFARFEVETPPSRKILKWLLVIAPTLLLYRFAGHWALALPLGAGALGAAFHVAWCRRNGIDPLEATPRRRYYELRGWRWRD